MLYHAYLTFSYRFKAEIAKVQDREASALGSGGSSFDSWQKARGRPACQGRSFHNFPKWPAAYYVPPKTTDDLADKCNNTPGETHVFGLRDRQEKRVKHTNQNCAICFLTVCSWTYKTIFWDMLFWMLISFVGGDDDDEAQVLKKRRRKKKLSTSTLTKISSSSTDTQSGDSAPTQSFWKGHLRNWNGIRHRFYNLLQPTEPIYKLKRLLLPKFGHGIQSWTTVGKTNTPSIPVNKANKLWLRFADFSFWFGLNFQVLGGC